MEIFAFMGALWVVLMLLRLIGERAEAVERHDELRKIADERIRMVQLEKIPGHENVLFAFDGENNEFLGQGLTEEELKQRIIERFPEKVFILRDKVFSGLKGNIEASFENSTTS